MDCQFGNVVYIGTDSATPVFSSIHCDSLPATISSVIEIGTASSQSLHDATYAMWTIGTMILLSIGILTALLYMRGRSL